MQIDTAIGIFDTVIKCDDSPSCLGLRIFVALSYIYIHPNFL